LSYKTIKIVFNNTNLCGIGQFGQCQIYSSERQNSTRTKLLVLTKKQVIDIVSSLRTQAANCELPRTRVRISSTHSIPSEPQNTARQSLNFTSMAKPNYGVDQRRSCQFRVEEWTDLGCQNRPFYTQIFWKTPN